MHSGFADIWGSFYLNVLASVTELHNKYPTQRIVVTGHSLGGALATLAGFDLREKFGDLVSLI